MVFDIAVVNYNTAFYLHHLLQSIAAGLPPAHVGAVHVWDNGSIDESAALLDAWSREAPWVRPHRSPINVHHGPALHALLTSHCRADWVLLLDADTAVRCNFVPDVARCPLADAAFVGQLHPQTAQLYAYLAHVLVNRAWYRRLPPFCHDGAPGLAFFRAIEERGIPYVRFRWCDYIQHAGQGALRQIYARGERSHAFYTFAAREASHAPASPERLDRELRLRMELDAFLASPRREIGARATPGRERLAVRAGADVFSAAAEPFVGDAPPAQPRRPPLRQIASALATPRLEWRLRQARRLGLVQQRWEMRQLVGLVERLRARRVLEIGTAYGGSLYLWTRAARPDARIVSIDLPPWELDDRGEAHKVAALAGLARGTQRIYLLRASSHDPRTIKQLADILTTDRLDFLFIDGDHSYDGVKRDVLEYSPLVRPGGLVALHDIHPHSKGWGGDVPRLWQEIKGGHEAIELVADRGQDGYGIGVLRV